MAIPSEFVNALQQFKAGQLDLAEQTCSHVPADDAYYADAVHLQGLIAYQRGNVQAAIERITRATEIDSGRASFFNNLGNLLKDQKQIATAVAAYRQAHQLAPNDAVICAHLGTALQLQGDLEGAIGCFWKAIEQNPADAGSLYHLAIALMDQGEREDAAAIFHRLLELTPHEPAIHTQLAMLCQLQGKLSEALEWFQKALDMNTNSAETYNNLGSISQNLGRLDDTAAYLHKALEIVPDYAGASSNLLVALQYREGITPAELVVAHAEYERRHAQAMRSEWQPLEFDRNPERPLTLGFISPNFAQHPVGHFVIGAIENFDKQQFRTVCYSDRIGGDAWTKRFRDASSVWRESVLLSDAELAAQIRADRVDILFELAGHTARNRLLVCARRPAPVQITWADYVGTTGLATIDYLMADHYEVPPGADVFYCERVIRMPNGYVCFDPPPYAPPVGPLPASKQGFVTFSSFNYRPKITLQTIAVWAKILQRVPNSRLVLKNRGMDDAAVAGPIQSEFLRRGVQPERIQCRGWSAHAELLAEYQRVDIGLDPYPYNGGLTTCEALWMGVPVITCPGETFASRHSLSHLSNVGLTETITPNLDEYVEVAVALASDLPRLAAIRSGLRERVAASPLCDAKRFAHDLMHVLREIWRGRCQER